MAEINIKGKKFNEMTPEELSEAGRQGGLKGAETKRNKKAMKETLEILLSMPLNGKKNYDVDDVKNFAALSGKNVDVQTAIIIRQLQRALKGDLASAEFIRDTSGQKPKSESDMKISELSATVQIIDDIKGDDND